MVYNRPVVHLGNQTQVSRLGTDFVHPKVTMEALLTLLALPVIVMSSIAGAPCAYQDEIIGVVQQDTTMTQEEKDTFISRVKTKYPQCFVETS